MPMTESPKQLCGSCPSAENKNTIEFWCFDCSESICIECKEKHFGKFHVIIPMSEAGKVDKSVITGPCTCTDKCSQNSYLHCKSHDKIYCKLCAPSIHKSCSDVQSIANAATGCQHRTSVLITDLELRLGNLKTNYLQLIEEQELNLTDLNFQKYQIKAQVCDFRKDMNEYLNELEDKIGNQLDRYYEQCRAQISKNIQAILERCNMLSLLENTLHLLITNSSECRTFIAAKNIDRKQCEEESVFETFEDFLKLFKLSFLKEETNDINKKFLRHWERLSLK
ncbi:PML [Mytilus coruscus]|uniref:PML n=1 Tax=Mytilus coruscus TaxID=42192 RepID=A0A6J8AID4_MYTCO|nr:PML [Mytilus coruscus]